MNFKYKGRKVWSGFYKIGSFQFSIGAFFKKESMVGTNELFTGYSVTIAFGKKQLIAYINIETKNSLLAKAEVKKLEAMGSESTSEKETQGITTSNYIH